MADNKNLPIGVFDSGVGGLTVLKALKQQLPHESFIYLGDTARVPYGIKSPNTVARYAKQAANVLYGQGIKMLVVACNTASAFALDALKANFDDIPIVNVITPGANAACRASSSGEILVIATESTVQHQAYHQAIHAIAPETKVYAQSCSLFVSLAEEGWVEGPIAEAVAKQYLHPLIAPDSLQQVDCLVLGCTHFPALQHTIEKIVPSTIRVIDSAQTTAKEVAALLQEKNLAHETLINNVTTRFLATDSPERFSRVAGHFLGEHLLRTQVELVDL